MQRLAWIASLLLALPAGAVGWDAPAPKPKTAPPANSAGQAGDSAVSGVAGAYAFRTHCASCHGIAGKGDGPLTEDLRFHPPDLTLIARRHGGSFPTEKIVRIVDGRDPVKGHGGADMPVWGDAFKNADTNYDDRQVREKVRTVVEYLKTLQQK
jgi:mono/diheme cytochrome c family protein